VGALKGDRCDDEGAGKSTPGALSGIATCMRKRLDVSFAFFVLVAMTTPLRADENANLTTLKFASHSYAIPRELIELVMKPDYSRVANPNPNWPHDPAVLLELQWPEFTAPTIRDPQEKLKRTINVALSAGTVGTVARYIERLHELQYSPEISDAPYGLRELRGGLWKDFQEYIASPDGGPEFMMHCDRPEKLFHSCEYSFDYLDIKVDVYFHSPFLSSWRDIHQKTLALLGSIRKD
jgi:hypothetical protein